MYFKVYEMTTPHYPENIVTMNPLNTSQIKVSDRPMWLCKHSEARILSFDPRRFICAKCDKGYILKIVSQRDILGTLSSNLTMVEHKE